jgi:hypothetical protein
VSWLTDALKAMQSPLPADYWQQPFDQQLAGLGAEGLGMGATGPLGVGGVLKRVGAYGPEEEGIRTLQSWRGTPPKLRGEASYEHLGPDYPPTWNMIWSNSPLATGEIWKGLEKELGPRLDEMVLNPMLPEAIPGWEAFAKSKRTDPYPNLKRNMLEYARIGRETNLPSDIPQNTYATRAGKGYAEGRSLPDEIDWDRIGVTREEALASGWRPEHEFSPQQLQDWGYTGVTSRVPGEPGSNAKPGQWLWDQMHSSSQDMAAQRLEELATQPIPDALQAIREWAERRPSESTTWRGYLETILDHYRTLNENRTVGNWSLD